MASVTHWGRLEPRSVAPTTSPKGCGPKCAIRCGCWPVNGSWVSSTPTTADRPWSPRSAHAASRDRVVPGVLGRGRRRRRRVRPTRSVRRARAGPPRPAYARPGRPAVRGAPRAPRAARVLPAFVDAFAVSRLSADDVSDDASERFAAAVAGRVVDGGALLDAALDNVKLWSLTPAGAIATRPRRGRPRRRRPRRLVHPHLRRADGRRRVEPGPARVRVRHRVGGRRRHRADARRRRLSGRQARLVRQRPRGGAAAPAPSPGRGSGDRFLPMPVQFHGMPSSRWWELEDARTDFGAVRPNATDLGLLLLAEFALIYADDWFVTPSPVPVGVLVSVTSWSSPTRSANARGSRRQDRGSDDVWQRFGVFDLTRRDGTRASADGLLVPPATAAHSRVGRSKKSCCSATRWRTWRGGSRTCCRTRSANPSPVTTSSSAPCAPARSTTSTTTTRPRSATG